MATAPVKVSQRAEGPVNAQEPHRAYAELQSTLEKEIQLMLKPLKRNFCLIFALGALTLAGCATVVKGSSQTITINTYPPNAICAVMREGRQIAVVNPTPGTLNVAKDSDTITVVCKKAGFLDAKVRIASEIDSMTFGNILLIPIYGEVIGVAVDAGSGAMHRYSPLVSITLVPKKFETVQERDEFFESMRKNVVTEAATAKDRIEKRCSEDSCKRQLDATDRAQERSFAQIEKLRLSAKVTP